MPASQCYSYIVIAMVEINIMWRTEESAGVKMSVMLFWQSDWLFKIEGRTFSYRSAFSPIHFSPLVTSLLFYKVIRHYLPILDQMICPSQETHVGELRILSNQNPDPVNPDCKAPPVALNLLKPRAAVLVRATTLWGRLQKPAQCACGGRWQQSLPTVCY